MSIARLGATGRSVVSGTKLSSLYGHKLFHIHCSTSFLSCPSHKVLPHAGTCNCPLCDDGEDFGEQGSSSSRHQRRWAIVCGSPQSQLTDCMLTMYPHLLIVVLARPIIVALQYRHGMNGTWRLRQMAPMTRV